MAAKATRDDKIRSKRGRPYKTYDNEILDPDADDYLKDRPLPQTEPRRPAVRNCVNCGKTFRTPPSDHKTRTCSPSCSSAHRRRMHYGKSNKWSPQARARKSYEGQTQNLKRGTDAARQSPKSGPYTTNINAKTWLVTAPGGAPTYEARNLRLWCEQHAALFAPDPWRNAYSGMRQVTACLRGKRNRKVSSWKGWTVEEIVQS